MLRYFLFDISNSHFNERLRCLSLVQLRDSLVFYSIIFIEVYLDVQKQESHIQFCTTYFMDCIHLTVNYFLKVRNKLME